MPTNPGLLELVRTRREWSWKPSISELKLGFRGWHQRGYIPHFDAPNITQMVTFMLADSFPAMRRAEWEPLLKGNDSSLRRRKLEDYLDRGHGECWLRHSDIARIVQQTLVERDGRDYQMHAWTIMPNHVHLVVNIWDVPLAKLVPNWKGKSSRESNRVLKRSGAFWQADYYDTFIRDENHLKRAIRYTEQNSVKAFLSRSAREWPWSSAGLRDEYERLPWQRDQ